MPSPTILHPTDFSDCANHAFELACAVARDRGARLLLLHVILPPAAHGEVVARRQAPNYYDELWNALRAMRPTHGEIPIDHRLEEGDPAEVILRVAQESASGLIVLGTHGRTGVSRLLMGSVADEVVRKAACPVLTIRASVPVKEA